jgi:hypothetical protein
MGFAAASAIWHRFCGQQPLIVSGQNSQANVYIKKRDNLSSSEMSEMPHLHGEGAGVVVGLPMDEQQRLLDLVRLHERTHGHVRIRGLP